MSINQWFEKQVSKQHFHKVLRLTMMTSTRVVKTSITVTDKSPFQDYSHLDNHTTQIIDCYSWVQTIYCITVKMLMKLQLQNTALFQPVKKQFFWSHFVLNLISLILHSDATLFLTSENSSYCLHTSHLFFCLSLKCLAKRTSHIGSIPPLD